VILTELQGYVRRRERVSLAELSTAFGAQPDALRGMLDRLVAKGRIRRLQRPARCAGCTICPREALEFYAWAGLAPAQPTPRVRTRLGKLDRDEQPRGASPPRCGVPR